MLLPAVAFAQEATGDTVRQQTAPKKLTEKKEQLWDNLNRVGIRPGLNASRLLVGLFNEDNQFYDLQADINIANHFFIPLEFGFASHSRSDEFETFLYESEGSYFRTGLDVNLLFRQSGMQAITLGLRYGTATYQHALAYSFAAPYWGDGQRSLEGASLRANWLEFVFGIRLEVLKNLYIAPFVRYKALGNSGAGPELAASVLPGYGNALSNSNFEFNYSLFYNLPSVKLFERKKKPQKKAGTKPEAGTGGE